MKEENYTLSSVISALNNLEIQKSKLIDLRDRLLIEDFQKETGLYIGKEVILHDKKMTVTSFEMYAWPIAICTNTVDGINYTYKLTDWDLKSMGIKTYDMNIKTNTKVLPDINIIMDKFEKSTMSENHTYKSEKDIAKGLLNIISEEI